MSVSSSTTSTRGRPDMSPMVGSARARDRGGWRRPGGCGPSPSKWPGMATRRRKRRRSRGLWPPLDLPQLEQRHWDVIGLALVAFAAFFACVFYLDWSGGEVGEAMADGFLFLFGGLGYLPPVALFAAGALLVVRPMMERVHPFRTGAACLAAALLLGLAAGSLGLGPGDTPRDGFLDADYLRRHAAPARAAAGRPDPGHPPRAGRAARARGLRARGSRHPRGGARARRGRALPGPVRARGGRARAAADG